jgi:hypothetical protein
MNSNAIERFMETVRTRRALLGGVAAAGTAVAAIEVGDARPKRAKQRRRRRRGRQNGGGNGLGDGCLVCQAPGPCPYRTIQAAIDDSRGEGAFITVCPGTYQERLRLNSTVQGNFLTIQGSGSNETIIDADGDGTAVTVFPGTVATLESVTVTGGKAALGGGIVNRGRLTLKNCTIAKNGNGAADNGGGGGIYNAPSARLTATETNITENTALDGQGGGILNDGGAVELQAESEVTKNMADQGGGIFNRNGGTVTLAGGSVSDNEPDNCVGTTACDS